MRAMSSAVSGLPSTTTACDDAWRVDSTPAVDTSTVMPWPFNVPARPSAITSRRSGLTPTSAPRDSRERNSDCSTSSTCAPCAASTRKNDADTPGRSGPVAVTTAGTRPSGRVTVSSSGATASGAAGTSTLFCTPTIIPCPARVLDSGAGERGFSGTTKAPAGRNQRGPFFVTRSLRQLGQLRADGRRGPRRACARPCAGSAARTRGARSGCAAWRRSCGAAAGRRWPTRGSCRSPTGRRP